MYTSLILFASIHMVIINDYVAMVGDAASCGSAPLHCFWLSMAQRRTGNLVKALHIFKYLDQNKKNELAFDPAYHNVEDPALVQAQMKAMKEMYPDTVEDMPPNSPLTRGNPVKDNCFVDIDHARDNVT